MLRADAQGTIGSKPLRRAGVIQPLFDPPLERRPIVERRELGDRLSAVGHDDVLTCCRPPDVLGEAGLEFPDADLHVVTLAE